MKNIIVVESDKSYDSIFNRNISPERHDVTLIKMTGNGEEIFNIEAVEDVYCVIINIDTIGAGWEKYVQKVKSEYPESKIIITANLAKFEYVQYCIRNDIEDILIKPYTTPDILTSLKAKPQYGMFDCTQNLNTFSDLVQRALTYINDNYSKGMKLGEMAADLNVSTWHLCKALKSETRKNFVEILCETRVKKAKQLLLETNIKVSEVSQQVGINEQAYFVSMFKKYVGITPSVYRRTHNLGEGQKATS